MPSIRLLTGRVLREASCLTGSLERGHLTSVLSPPPQPFAFCPFHKLVSIRTPLDPKPDGRSESTVGRDTKEGRPPRHAFDSSMGPPYPERWLVWVFWFPVFKVSHSQLPPSPPKKKGSTPHPSPTLSSEPSERKPRSHATRPVWLRLRFGASAQRFQATPRGASSPQKSEAEPVPLLSDLDASPEASVRLHKPGSTRVERKENGARGPAVQGTFFLGAPVTRFTPVTCWNGAGVNSNTTSPE